MLCVKYRCVWIDGRRGEGGCEFTIIICVYSVCVNAQSRLALDYYYYYYYCYNINSPSEFRVVLSRRKQTVKVNSRALTK